MIRQDSVLTLQNGSPPDPDHTLVWEVRHAGLLGIKYEVAVRNDLFERVPKQEEGLPDIPCILKDVVDAAILGSVLFDPFVTTLADVDTDSGIRTMMSEPWLHHVSCQWRVTSWSRSRRCWNRSWSCYGTVCQT